MSYRIKYLIQQEQKRRHEERVLELRRGDGIPVAPEAGVDGVPELVNYNSRSPRDVVISGPVLGKGKGPGREFSSKEAALAWARGKYGENNVKLLRPYEDLPRWAILVKNLRST
jgi:hypothetical protein